jgi:acetolactate synthase regulatory subunit
LRALGVAGPTDPARTGGDGADGTEGRRGPVTSTAPRQARVALLHATADGAAVRRFSLLTTEAPDALVRVLCLLRRRGCTVVSVDLLRGDRHRPGRLAIAVRTDSRAAHRLRAWLLQLVDVLAVEEGW